MSLPEHFERYLGPICRGWSDEKRMHGIQIVSFENQPETNVRTFATLGLSRHLVDLPGPRQIRQELLMSANDIFSADSIAKIMLFLAEQVVQRGKALLRGEVIGMKTPIFPDSMLTSIYVTNPSPFAESLTKFDSGVFATVFAYLIPIAETEATFVYEEGWDWFEDQLEQQNPDIWNLARTEVVQRS